jgi:hypothetical protein
MEVRGIVHSGHHTHVEAHESNERNGSKFTVRCDVTPCPIPAGNLPYRHVRTFDETVATVSAH